MNETKATQSESDEITTEPLDLRTELRSNLTDEFNIALSSCTALTDHQRTALSKAVSKGPITTATILQTLSATEE
jgi:predicted DNA binding protein